MQTSTISRGPESCDAKPLQYSFTNDELSGPMIPKSNKLAATITALHHIHKERNE
jgi:hypothetical protein